MQSDTRNRNARRALDHRTKEENGPISKHLMKSPKFGTLLLSFLTVSTLVSHGQSNHTALLRAAATHIAVPKPVVTPVTTNTPQGRAVVDVNLPKELSRYHVLEQHDQITRPSTNFSATSAQKGRASLAAGTTLMF